jgi:hypothetical protein
VQETYREIYDSETVMFEHGLVDATSSAPTSINHVHLHCLPVPNNGFSISSWLKKKHNLNDIIFDDLHDISQIIHKNRINSYLLYYDVDHLFHLINISDKDLPSQFLRKELYEILLSSTDDGWDWKKHEHRDIMLQTFDDLYGLGILVN